VFGNRITLSFTGKTGDIDVVHTPVIKVQRRVAAGWPKPITAELDPYVIGGEQHAVPCMAATGLRIPRHNPKRCGRGATSCRGKMPTGLFSFPTRRPVGLGPDGRCASPS